MSFFKKTQEEKNCALGKAILHGNVKGVRSAIENGAILTGEEIPYDYTDGSYDKNRPLYLLECAVRNNYIESEKVKEVLKLMIGAGLPRVLSDGNTLLHYVCQSSRLCTCPGLVEMLIHEFSFDVRSRNRDHYMPFDFAISNRTSVAEHLLSLGGVGPRSVDQVIEHGKKDWISKIIPLLYPSESGVSDDSEMKYVRENALRRMINEESMAEFDYLMSLKGMDFSCSFDGGSRNFLTVVDVTVSNAGVTTKMVKKLLAAGVPIEGSALPHFCGVSPAVPGIDDIVLAILRKGEEQGIMDKLGLNLAVQQAIQHDKNHKILTRLLDAGADINAEDLSRDQETLLIAAVRRCDIETVEFLIARGADIKKRNSQGITAYDMAITKMQEIAKKSQNDNTRRTLLIYERIRDLVSLEAASDVPKVAQSTTTAEDDIYSVPNKMSLEIDQGGGLTITFNFWTQQVIYRDATGAMNVQPFDKIQRQAAVTEAYEKLKELGGTPPDLTVIDMPGKKRSGGGLTSLAK